MTKSRTKPPGGYTEKAKKYITENRNLIDKSITTRKLMKALKTDSWYEVALTLDQLEKTGFDMTGIDLI